VFASKSLRIGGKSMNYEEPRILILKMNKKKNSVICESNPGGIQDGGEIPEIGKDEGGYN